MSILNLAYGKNTPILLPNLCFTANTANSTVGLYKSWTPTEVTLETSTDWTNWSTYTFDTDITLSNIWDKVYWRNTSETTTWFSKNQYDYYRFIMNGSISASGDITYLLNKNWADTVPTWWFRKLFASQTSLTSAPDLPATTVWDYGYYDMFNGCTSLVTAPTISATTVGWYSCYSMFIWCTNLEELPELKTLDLASYCYYAMFQWCSKIKLSATQTWEYQTPYRIPITWTWVYHYGTELSNMFYSTWWTFTWAPTINTTYYTSNTVV